MTAAPPHIATGHGPLTGPVLGTTVEVAGETIAVGRPATSTGYAAELERRRAVHRAAVEAEADADGLVRRGLALVTIDQALAIDLGPPRPRPGDHMPPLGPRRNAAGESADQARTRRRAEALAAGIHPVTRRPLLRLTAEPGDEAAQTATCGTCAHHVVRRLGGTYHKCHLKETGGAATDLRVRWPACVLYEPQEPTE